MQLSIANNFDRAGRFRFQGICVAFFLGQVENVAVLHFCLANQFGFRHFIHFYSSSDHIELSVVQNNFGPLEDEHHGHWNSQTFCLRDRFGGEKFAVSEALDGMKVDTIFYWSLSPFALPLVEKSAWSGSSRSTSDSENARQWHFIRAERSSNGSE